MYPLLIDYSDLKLALIFAYQNKELKINFILHAI